jgi:hypothetical protein
MRRAYRVIVGATVGVLCLLLWVTIRPSGDISRSVPIIDVSTGNRITNASAFYVGYKGYPIVSNLVVLPAWMRGRSKFDVKVRDGYLHLPRYFNQDSRLMVQIRVSAPGYSTGNFAVVPNDPERFLKQSTGVRMAPTNYFSQLDLPATGGSK